MAPTSVNCEYTGCNYKTPEGDLPTAVELLKMHFSAKHIVPNSEFSKAGSKVEKAKRPEIALEMTDEDWAYFLNRWSAYKKATGIVGEDIVLQLLECCCDQLRKDHYRNYPNFNTTDSEDTILS